jgi:8-oxo-dGTP diphosphatase
VPDQSDAQSFARPFVAAGALILDDAGRVLLVHPTYKDGWDIPGGYVEGAESPRAACLREIREELGLTLEVGNLLVVDWAPAAHEGDKILFIFDGGVLNGEHLSHISLPRGELAEWQLAPMTDLPDMVPDRLLRRLLTAVTARQDGRSAYAEQGLPYGTLPGRSDRDPTNRQAGLLPSDSP